MKKTGAFVIVGVVVALTAVVLSAQSRDVEPAVSRELVTEMRALRNVIERYADTQIQTQAITGLLDAQQRRLAEANARLDIVRRELDATTTRFQSLSRAMAEAEQMSPKELTLPGGVPPIDARQALEHHRSDLLRQFESVSAQLQQLRTREGEALNQVTADETRWNELVGRLDQWLRR
jgi:hypothetical protein